MATHGSPPEATEAFEVPVAGVSGLRLLDNSLSKGSWAMSVIEKQGGSHENVLDVARWLTARGRALEARGNVCGRGVCGRGEVYASMNFLQSSLPCRFHEHRPCALRRQALPLYEQLLASSPDSIDYLIAKGNCSEVRDDRRSPVHFFPTPPAPTEHP